MPKRCPPAFAKHATRTLRVTGSPMAVTSSQMREGIALGLVALEAVMRGFQDQLSDALSVTGALIADL